MSGAAPESLRWQTSPRGMQFFRGDYYSTLRGSIIGRWGIMCRLIQNIVLAEAVRCIELARRARTLEGRQTFQNLAEKWKGLAADIERAEASLEELNETGFRRSPTYPYD